MLRQAAGASPAETVTIENPGGRREGGQSETLVLRLNRKKKKVSWKPGTVDNELMQKKSSKKCCIFHKEKSFDEDDSDNDDDDHHPHHHHHHHHEEDRDPDGACSSKDGH